MLSRPGAWEWSDPASVLAAEDLAGSPWVAAFTAPTAETRSPPRHEGGDIAVTPDPLLRRLLTIRPTRTPCGPSIRRVTAWRLCRKTRARLPSPNPLSPRPRRPPDTRPASFLRLSP